MTPPVTFRTQGLREVLQLGVIDVGAVAAVPGSDQVQWCFWMPPGFSCQWSKPMPREAAIAALIDKAEQWIDALGPLFAEPARQFRCAVASASLTSKDD